MKVIFSFIQKIFPSVYINFPSEKSIFLTFDDGPSVNTDCILDTLDKYDAKATFFLLGKNAEKYQDKIEIIKSKGHSLGYHSFEHKNLLRTLTSTAIKDYEKCKEIFDSTLYRPPYGKLSLGFYKYIKNKCKIILWDVSFRDWETHDNLNNHIDNKLKKINPGSIILLHDNEKSEENLKVMLPMILEYIAKKGFEFDGIQIG